MPKAFVLTWGPDVGYSDIIQVRQFAREARGVESLHLVRGPRGGEYQARYRLNVKAKRATLDYRAFNAFNTHAGMELGVFTLHFTNSNRTSLARVDWNGTPLSNAELTFKVENVSDTTGDDTVVKLQKRLALIAARPEQVRFRRELGQVYAGRCCITGCPVRWSVEAAHIRPVANKPSFVTRNGLLLRRDIHALFDAGQIGINPNSPRCKSRLQTS